MAGIHDVFHVSQLKKCLRVPTEEADPEHIELQKDLTYVEKPVRILVVNKRNTRNRIIRFCKVRQVEERPVRSFAAAAIRRSVAVNIEPSRAAVKFVVGLRSPSFVVVLCFVSDVPEESVYVEEGSKAFEEAQGKSHRSQTTL
uniref:Retrotransposon protein, putative, Ty3-gypsy subclass n=1 Tax=Oryza sativa subsp. japonica TaxID=39947 RepID=Q33AL9_ORYSJ|nr:retrotransposon protein, putative, Ty3-gypsy subclass [Oryza sativa Japonica Group]